MALGIDGYASGYALYPTGGTVAVTLSTTKTNDIIIVAISWADGDITFNISDTAGLHWQRRADENTDGGAFIGNEYYAVSSGILSNDIITVASSGGQLNNLGVIAFAVSGANTSTPYDVNGSLPATTGISTSASSLSATISTTATNTIIIGICNVAATPETFTFPSGFAAITSLTYSSAYGSNTLVAFYKVESSSQSGLAVSASWTSSGGASLIVDALQQGSSAPASTLNNWF